ncbi:hypothetical protein AAE028_12185 [Sinorhizobium sp. CB9]
MSVSINVVESEPVNQYVATAKTAKAPIMLTKTRGAYIPYPMMKASQKDNSVENPAPSQET